MTISSIDGVLMSSRDGLRLVAFYRDRLGLPLAEERHGSAAHWACRLGGIHLAIHHEPMTRDGAPIAVSFATDDVDALVRSLRSAGIIIEQEPSDRPFGRLAAVRDPDGNLIYLHARPPAR
jgi:glyoxylase I family protein